MEKLSNIQNTINCSDMSDLLKSMADNGILNLPSIKESLAMLEEQRFLQMHTHSVWQNAKGKWLTYLPAENKTGRMLYTRNTREELESVIINYYRENEENPTIEECFEEWLNRRVSIGKISKATEVRERTRFDRFFTELRHKKIKSITPLNIQDFLEEQVTKFHLTAKEFSNLKGLTKGFLRRAKKRGLISFNVNELMNELDVSEYNFRKRYIDDEKEIYYDDEMIQMMQYIKAHPEPINLGIALIFVTGIRIGELAVLRRSDFHGQTFDVHATETRYYDSETRKNVYSIKDCPKTIAGIRTVIIPTQMMWIVEEAMKDHPGAEWMFVDKKGERIKTSNFRKRTYTLDDKFGIPHKSPHKMRKTYCSILLDHSVDNKLIERQVGHTDIGVTEAHYHRDRRNLQSKIEIISGIPEFQALSDAISQSDQE